MSLVCALLPIAAAAQANVVTGDGVLTITLNAQPGAPLYDIQQNMKASFNAATRPDVLVIQGGVNDVFWFGQNLTTLQTNYTASLTGCIQYARDCGVPAIYLLELTPVIPEIVDVYSPYTSRVAPVQPKVELLNGILREKAALHGVNVIPIYDHFMPHWNETAESWCLWEGSDSVHPSAAGNRELGRAIAAALRLHAPPGRPLRLTLVGDSILAAAGWPVKDQPVTWLREFLLHPPSAARRWRRYE